MKLDLACDFNSGFFVRNDIKEHLIYFVHYKLTKRNIQVLSVLQ